MYLKEQPKYVDNLWGESDVLCKMLYDSKSNWIRLRIPRGGNNRLRTGSVDYPIHFGMVTETEEEILLLFDRDSIPVTERDQACHIDIHPEGIYGIEIILWSSNPLGLKEKVRPFIIRDL